jgi:XTP/dITP diphosphohydrolase
LRDLLVATHNQGKLREIQEALQGLPYRLVTAQDLPAVEESGETLLANAQLKARAGAKFSGLLCLADDSGLEVDALGGEPGVYSARWSGPEANAAANNAKLLAELQKLGPAAPRDAVFRTVMVLAEAEGREDWVAGHCEGIVPKEPLGTEGFGYDPLFYVPTARKTFAQMSLQEKQRFSHRGAALDRLRKLLERW